MALSLKSISKEAVVRAPRILLLGAEKIGKTSFACGCHFENGKLVETGINNPVIIPIKGEEGADALKVGKFPTCNTYQEVLDSIKALAVEDHDYKTAVLDSASALNPIVEDHVCFENGEVSNIRKVSGFKTGEAAVTKCWGNIRDYLDVLRNEKNMAVIIVGHIKVRNHKNPEGDDYHVYDFDLDMPDVTELLKRWVDVILFANTKVVVKKEGEDTKFSKAKRTAKDITGGKRFLFTQKTTTHPGGGRDIFGHLPYELPLDWVDFEKAVAEAMK